MVDFMEYFAIILKPEETMRSIVKKPDMRAADQAVLLMGGMAGLILGIIVALFASFASVLASIAGQGTIALIASLGFLAIIILPILFAIIGWIGSKISYWIFYKVTSLLGGKGTFDQNFWLGSQLIWPAFFAQLIVYVLGLIPILGGLIAIVWFFYTIYLFVVLLSVANNVSKGKALASWIVTVVLMIIIAIVLMTALLAILVKIVAY